MKLNNLIEFLENNYPKSLAESWDNVGLLIGDENKEVKHVLVCLEVTLDVIEEAIDKHVDLIISHHPVIFSGVKEINFNTLTGKKIQALIKHDIGVYAMHTNVDSASDGLADWFADFFDYSSKKAFIKADTTFYKIIYYVPKENHDTVLQRLFKAGAGHIGYYDSCSFTSNGTGTFRPLDEANPAIGTHGEVEFVDENKVEIITDDRRLNTIIDALLKVHPY